MRRLLLTALLLHALSAFSLAQDKHLLLTAAIRDHNKSNTTASFRHAFVDLNDDGIEDAVVLMREPSSCGSGGCNMMVFRGTKSGFAFVSSSTITNPPIRVSTEKTAGWKTLIVYARGVGDVVMRFDGRRYPLNPSVQSKANMALMNAAKTVLKSFPPLSLWSFTEEARYQSLREPNGIDLEDGRAVSYESAGSFTSAVLSEWPKGRRILLAYGPEYGSALVDPETQEATTLRFITKDHPIDRMTEKCLEREPSTTGTVACYATALSNWDGELNRFYAELMTSLNSDQKRAIQTAQREWLQYRDAQKAAIVAIYTDGTISRIEQAIAINDLTKQQAQKLGLLLAR